MRIIRTGYNETVKFCYNFHARNNTNNINWATLLKYELDSIGLGYIWIQMERNEISIERCDDTELQNTCNNMNWNSTIQFYKIKKRE
jgi:hypothetical protein